VLGRVEEARRGFDSTSAKTMIHIGERLKEKPDAHPVETAAIRPPQPPPSQPAPVVAAPAPKPATTVAKHRKEKAKKPAATPTPTPTAEPQPQPTLIATATPTPTPQPQPQPVVAAPPQPVAHVTPVSAAAPKPALVASVPVSAAPPKPAPMTSVPVPAATPKPPAVVAAAPVPAAPPQPTPIVAAPVPAPAPKPATTAVKHHNAKPKKPAATPAPQPQPVVAAAIPAPPPPPPRVFGDADAAQVRAVLAAQTEAWNGNDLARYLATYARSPEPELADGTTTVRGWQPLADYYRVNFIRQGVLGTLAYSDVHVSGITADIASVAARIRVTDADGGERSGDVTMELRRLPDGWKVVRIGVPSARIDERLSQSRGVRLLSGAAALMLPRSVGEALGLFHIGGGRGMLWFAEVDTVLFDLVLLCALLALIARSSASWRNPLTWLVLLITLLIAGPLIYSVSNFGTLFRLREMVYVGLLLTPLAVAARGERDVRHSDV
jgi:ketosteroid isomerase-like protein